MMEWISLAFSCHNDAKGTERFTREIRVPYGRQDIGHLLLDISGQDKGFVIYLTCEMYEMVKGYHKKKRSS